MLYETIRMRGVPGNFFVIIFIFFFGYILLVPCETEKTVIPHDKVKKVSNEDLGVILYNSRYELVLDYYFIHNLNNTEKFDILLKEEYYFYNTFSRKELVLEKK